MTVSLYSLSVSRFPITVKAVFDIYIYMEMTIAPVYCMTTTSKCVSADS